MKGFNIFKKISLFFTYSNIIKSNKTQLELEYNARIDNIYRIYTVLNIPENIFEEPYNLRKTDIDTIAKNYILDYRGNLSNFLISKGLMELFEVYDVRKVDKYSYLIILGFSLFNTKKLVNNLLIWIPIITSLIVIFYFIRWIFQTS
jgi:hypothetical protein